MANGKEQEGGRVLPFVTGDALAGTVKAELANDGVNTVGDEATYDDPFIGQMVNGYKIGRRINSGGMGFIYTADHAELGMECVVKILRPELATEAERFLEEAREMARLHNDGCVGIVRVFNLGRIEVGGVSYPYFMMDMLNGCDLATEMDTQGVLPCARVVEIVAQVAETLVSVHNCGTIHRDLKPENIFLAQQSVEGRDRAVLLDFGVAKRLGSKSAGRTQAGMVIGTPYYMSPEQVEPVDGLELDNRSDVFSLGAVLYHMLAGDRPFKGTSTMRVLSKILDDKEPSRLETVRSDLPAGLADVVHQMLAKSRDDRPSSMAEVLDLLAPFRPTRALTPTSGSVGVASQALKDDGARAQRNWWKVVGLSALVMVVAVLIIAGVVALRSGDEKVLPSADTSTVAPVVAESATKVDAGGSADGARDQGKTGTKPRKGKKSKAKRQAAPPAPATSGDPAQLRVE